MVCRMELEDSYVVGKDRVVRDMSIGDNVELRDDIVLVGVVEDVVWIGVGVDSGWIGVDEDIVAMADIGIVVLLDSALVRVNSRIRIIT